MSLIQHEVLLGVILRQAGLLSESELKQGLEQQNQGLDKSKIGVILANQGYINQKTADFFAERWSESIREQPKKPLAQYLKQAGLLTELQIQTILTEQKRTNLKFGELAIAKGWLKRTTVDFFLHYLFGETNTKPKEAVRATKFVPVSHFEPTAHSTSADKWSRSSEQLEYSQKVHEGFLQIKRKLLKLEDRDAYSETALRQVLLWTGGQSILTQKLFELLSHNTIDLAPKPEIEQINYLVQTKLIDDWENNAIGQHLQTIRDRLLDNRLCSSVRLLELYQEILNKAVPIDRSREQQELLNMGLVVKQQEQLVVANRIYQLIFNSSWVTKQLGDRSNQYNSKIDRQLKHSKSGRWLLSPSNTEPGTAVKRHDLAETIQTVDRNRFSLLKNALLLLTFVGLLSLLFNNIAERISVRVAFWRGNQLLKQKLYEQAITEYDRLLNRDSNYHQAWTYRGYGFAGLQRYREMLDSCSTATIIETRALYAWNCRGEALYNLGKNQEAISAFDTAIAIDPAKPIFSINKSKSLEALGRNEESVAVILEAIRILERIEVANQEQDISDEFAVALTFLGNSYVKNEQAQGAIDSYTRALTYVPNYFPAQIGKGIALNMARRYDEAQNEFNGILDNTLITPTQQAQTLFYLGKTLCGSQQSLSGIAALEKAAELKPNYQIAEQAIEKCT